MIRLAFAALLLAAPAAADDQTTCLLAATRMVDAIAADVARRGVEPKADLSTPEARAIVAERQARKMMTDPEACAIIAAAPDSFIAAMTRRAAD